MKSKSFYFLIVVVSIIAILVTSIIFITSSANFILENRFSLGIISIVFGLSALLFLWLDKSGSSLTWNINKKRFFLIVLSLSILIMVWRGILIIKDHFALSTHYAGFFSSVFLVIAVVIVLRNIRKSNSPFS